MFTTQKLFYSQRPSYYTSALLALMASSEGVCFFDAFNLALPKLGIILIYTISYFKIISRILIGNSFKMACGISSIVWRKFFDEFLLPAAGC